MEVLTSTGLWVNNLNDNQMKKIAIYTLFSLAIFSGCKKNNEILVDGERPEERVTEALTKYKTTLTSSPFGWKAYLYPNGGGGYSFYLNFTDKNRVTMYADLDTDPATTSMESSYRIKANQIPSLLFDTYNYMHRLSDPNPNVFGGVSGWGLYSDFEFSFLQQERDTLKLEGKLLGSKFVLVKASKAEQDAYNAKGLYNSMVVSSKYFDNNKNLYFSIDGTIKLQTLFNYSQKTLSVIWDDKGTINTVSAPFVFTLTGVLLQNPLFVNGKMFSEFIWDATTGNFYTTVDNKRIDVIAASGPLLPLHALIGINYSSIIVPNATSYPGWSVDFVARRAAVANAILTGPYSLRLDRMIFSFNTGQQSLGLTTDIYQGATKFTGVFPFTYTKTTSGTYKFTAGAPTGNGSLIVKEMAPITTQRLSADQFTLDYFINPTTKQVLGQFKSVEHPDFTFSGTLQ